jgi:ribosome-binding protein aMBF1 (putative translation factor)
MKEAKKRRLEKAGWHVGDTQDFLGLTDAEMAMIEVRLNLARALRDRRLRLKISQQRFAERIGSSQSRVAKMEAGDKSVTVDLLMRSLLYAGSTAQEIGQTIGTGFSKLAAR